MNYRILVMMLALNILTCVVLGIHPTGVKAQEEPQHGGTLRIGVGAKYEMPKLFPYQGGGGRYKPTYLARCCWERLVTYNEKWEFIPELATDWYTPDGGKTWVFHLVRNATWHDGVKFTAADVKFHYETVSNRTWPETKIPLMDKDGIKHLNTVEYVTAPDNYTVEFHCYVPMPLDEVIEVSFGGFMCMPKHIFEGTDIAENPQLLHPIGTGPFKFVKHVEGVYVEFERNENYWQKDKPYVDRIIERFYPTPQGASIALEAGEIDYVQDGVYLTPLDAHRFQEDPGFDAGSYTYPNTIRLLLNLDPKNLEQVPALENREARRGLSYAINRESITKSVFLDMTKPNSLYYSVSQTWLRPPEIETHPYDPEKSKEMLDEAGYPVKGDGWRFDIGQMVCYPQYIDAGEIILSNWNAIGVKVEIRTMDMAAIVDKLEMGPDGLQTVPGVSVLLHTQSTGPAPGVVHHELHSEGLYPYHANIPEMDLAIDNALSQVEASARQAAYWEVMRLFDQEMPMIPICDKFRTYAWNVKVHGVPESLLPQCYFTKHANIWLYTSPTPGSEFPVVYLAAAVVVVIAGIAIVYAVRRRKKI